MMKRQRETEEKESIDLATSLMLLSRTQQNKTFSSPIEFECKTCNRKFSSFQALGGHRASHKKLKIEGQQESLKGNNNNVKKMHECSICGQEFKLGQALGGHMRRHRNNEAFSNCFEKSSPVLKRSNSKRVMCLELDLNLTPLENDLKLLFGNKAPRVDLSLF
ncbi:zinc finger protein ZAT7 [Cicer arietinum]|uniref:Zinc finger protein ZAT11 n=1 Tax=Cicer arietinum TaxID=3827 RepID=A0A1S2XWE8_CICAR|nr:zinc finger protein ZAT11 [Cicer arietinum]